MYILDKEKYIKRVQILNPTIDFSESNYIKLSEKILQFVAHVVIVILRC